MKIKFLGTAAAEGTPALFCSCDVCERARKLGGKNIRTRSQTLINDDLLIDFPADTYLHVLNYGLDLRKIKTLLITHGHDDHFYPFDLVYRCSPVFAVYPDNAADKKPLELYLTRNSGKIMRPYFKKERVSDDEKAISINYITKFKSFVSNGYKITPMRASHAAELDPVIYIIQKEDKALLYAHDSGYFPEDTWNYIKNSGIVFDFVSLDCTSTLKDGAYEYHMGLKACCDVKLRLIKEGGANDKTVFFVNHFSHNGGTVYDDLVELAREKGFNVSYDGLQTEI